MAAILLGGGEKGKRFALKNSKIMIHQPLGGVKGQASDIKIVADQILKTRNLINEILAKETGRTRAKIEEDTNRDYYLTSAEALEYGIIDKVLEKEKQSAKSR